MTTALENLLLVGVPFLSEEPADCPDDGETEEEERRRKDAEKVRRFWAKVGRMQKR